jgi:hypothetical protein
MPMLPEYSAPEWSVYRNYEHWRESSGCRNGDRPGTVYSDDAASGPLFKGKLVPKHHRALFPGEREGVAFCSQGGNSWIITHNKIKGATSTEAAANMLSLPTISG